MDEFVPLTISAFLGLERRGSATLFHERIRTFLYILSNFVLMGIFLYEITLDSPYGDAYIIQVNEEYPCHLDYISVLFSKLIITCFII